MDSGTGSVKDPAVNWVQGAGGAVTEEGGRFQAHEVPRWGSWCHASHKLGKLTARGPRLP